MNKPFIYNEDDEKVFLPYRMEVCFRCSGNGTHVNPSIDGNGISANDEIWQDDDFREGYFGGRYDVVCEECNGNNVVPVVDEVACDPSILALYQEEERAMAEMDAMSAAERAMGA
jgi:RecJ-like exonuclease